MMRTLHHLWLAIALVALAALSSCAGGLDDASSFEATDLCETDEDCPTAFTCQFGICAEEPGASYSIGLSITPPDFRPDLAGQQVTGVPVTLGTALPDYVLARPVQLSGIIAYDADDAPAVRADVRFRATSGVPGQAFATNVHTAPDGRVFTATLPPGIYDVTIIDDRPDVARVVRRGVNIGVDGAAGGPCPTDDPCQSSVFIVPAPERYVRVDGTLSRQTPRIEPVEGARVFARTVDERYTSTAAVTDVAGGFSLLVPPTDGEWRIHVEPDTDAPVPSGTFEPFTLQSDATGAEIALGFGELGDPVTVQGVVTGPSDRTVLVTARTTFGPAAVEPGALAFEGGSGEVEVVVEPDANGAFELKLVPGTWAITAAPIDASVGVAEPIEVEVIAGEPAAPIELALTEPIAVTGRIVAPDGTTPVPNATVEARFTSAWGTSNASYGVADALWTSTTATEEDGTWGLPLARGQWDLTVGPPDNLGYASWTTEIEVRDDGVVGDIALVEAGVVSGRILDEDATPIAGARVAGWQIVDGTSRLLDEAVTNDDGFWRLVLPARLEP